MGKDASHLWARVGRGNAQETQALPQPTMRFRRRSWMAFQRALDPLAPPHRLPNRRPR
jgi:hypothetical protein